jgi:hypothetical protein
MKNGVTIYGGFAGTETAVADRAIKDNPTILSGDLNGDDVYSGTGSTLSISNISENCYSVIRNDFNVAAVGPTAVLDGFIIRGGNANDGVISLIYGGGGMHNNETSPTIRNCKFEYNSANYGAAFFSWKSTSVFYNCVFVNNYGTNVSSLGGTIYNNAGNGLAFNNCAIVNNYSANRGGVISYNTTTILNNSIVWGNYSVNSGHQFFCTSNGNITLNYSCYQNETNDVYAVGGTFTASNNNINTDPKFVDAANGDYRIAGTSSCLDLGNDSYSTLTTDIRGLGFGRKLLKTNPLTTGTIDIGAYEYKFGTDPATLCANPSTGGEIAADQTICGGEIPNELTSISEPTGYVGTLEYQWQMSTVSPTFVDISGAVSPTYTPVGTVTQTTWYRRLARVTCDPVGWATATASNTVAITVRQAFTAGAINTTGETICSNEDPVAITNLTLASGGDGAIAYLWESSEVSASVDFEEILGTYTATYNPPTASQTIWYRRSAKDGTCNTTYTLSAGVWKVTVLDEFKAGTATGTQTICYGETPSELSASEPTGGSVVYGKDPVGFQYQWQVKNGSKLGRYPECHRT